MTSAKKNAIRAKYIDTAKCILERGIFDQYVSDIGFTAKICNDLGTGFAKFYCIWSKSMPWMQLNEPLVTVGMYPTWFSPLDRSINGVFLRCTVIVSVYAREGMVYYYEGSLETDFKNETHIATTVRSMVATYFSVKAK